VKAPAPSKLTAIKKHDLTTLKRGRVSQFARYEEGTGRKGQPVGRESREEDGEGEEGDRGECEGWRGRRVSLSGVSSLHFSLLFGLLFWFYCVVKTEINVCRPNVILQPSFGRRLGMRYGNKALSLRGCNDSLWTSALGFFGSPPVFLPPSFPSFSSFRPSLLFLAHRLSIPP
jgi:hypothetical protein